MREGWTYKKFTKVCDVQYGYPFDSKCFTEDSNCMPLIRIRDVQRGYSDTFYSGEIPDGYTIQEGDFLVGMDGEFNIGIWGKRPGVLNQRVCKMASSSEFLVNKYMFYFLKVCLKKIEDETPFVTVKHLSAKRINQIEIPLPPKSQQEAIISELDEINSLLALKREQLQKYDKLAQSLFYEMFGDPVENEKGWEVKKLGEMSTVKTGPFGSMLHKEDYISDGIPLINPMHMQDYKIVPNNEFSISEDKAGELYNYILQANDVIFARRGDIGRCAIVSDKEAGFLCGTGSLFVRFKQDVSPTYTMYVVKSDSFTKELISKAKGATMLNLNSTTMENLLFPLPPLSLQQQFASRIEQIESQKQQVQAAIEKLETLLASRMQYWFD